MLKYTLKYVFLFLVIATFCDRSIAQEYLVEKTFYDIEHGLSHRAVQSIYQSQEGYMWLGTQNGLNRFDGLRFKNYTRELYGLESNDIDHILEDSNGLLWLISSSTHDLKDAFHISIFNPTTETSQSFYNYFGAAAPFQIPEILAFNQHPDHGLVFLTEKKQLIFYQDTFRTVNVPEAFDAAIDLHIRDDGKVWLALQKQRPDNSLEALLLLVENTGGRLVQKINFPEQALVFPLNKVQAKHSRWYTSDPLRKILSFYKISPSGQQETLLSTTLIAPYPDAKFIAVFTPYPTAEELCLIDLDNRLLLQDSSVQKQTLLGSESDKTQISSIYQNKQGQVWVGTSFGLYQFNIGKKRFRHILQDSSDQFLATRGMVVDDQGRLWCVEEGERALWETSWQADNEVTQASDLLPSLKGVDINRFVSITKDQDGRLIFPPSLNQLVRFDPVTGDYETLRLPEKERIPAEIWHLSVDRQNRIWMGNKKGGIGYLEGANLHWIRPEDKAPGVFHIYQRTEDQAGNTWLASDGGLLQLDPDSLKIKQRFWRKGSGQNYLPFDNIHHIYPDPSKTSFGWGLPAEA